MNITNTGIAVGVAVVIALAFLFFGSTIFTPFQAAQTTTNATPTMATSSDAAASAANMPDPTSLQVKDLTVGTGTEAQAGDTVTVDYVGALKDGTVFDASQNHGQPFSFTLGAGQVIQGWDQGIVGMKEGGDRVLVIPASLGYGPQAVSTIPPNSTLIFEVKLIKVQKGS